MYVRSPGGSARPQMVPATRQCIRVLPLVLYRYDLVLLACPAHTPAPSLTFDSTSAQVTAFVYSHARPKRAARAQPQRLTEGSDGSIDGSTAPKQRGVGSGAVRASQRGGALIADVGNGASVDKTTRQAGRRVGEARPAGGEVEAGGVGAEEVEAGKVEAGEAEAGEGAVVGLRGDELVALTSRLVSARHTHELLTLSSTPSPSHPHAHPPPSPSPSPSPSPFTLQLHPS